MSERESHPSFGMIGAYRAQVSPPGAALFDSDIQHRNIVTVRISTASRKRDLHHDHIMADREIIEIEMSEAQWASFVSSMNTSGVPCTIAFRQGEGRIEGVPFAPRLEESMRETRRAAATAFGEITEAFADYEAKPTKDNLRMLRARISNAVPNVDFAGKSLAEHAENVVQKARADIEAIVAHKAAQLGIESPRAKPEIEAPDDEVRPEGSTL